MHVAAHGNEPSSGFADGAHGPLAATVEIPALDPNKDIGRLLAAECPRWPSLDDAFGVPPEVWDTALGNTQIGAADRRQRRYEKRKKLRSVTGIARVARCGTRAVSNGVRVLHRRDAAYWNGVEHCGSLWACPVCSSPKWAQRSREVAAAVAAHEAQGGQVAMLALTMRHHRGDLLEACWNALSDAWRAASSGNRRVRRAAMKAGMRGWVRRVEVTFGWGNGWHLHVHALLFLDAWATDTDVDELGVAMFDGWATRLAKRGLRPVRGSGGFDVKLLDLRSIAGRNAAAYVCKAAQEMTGEGKQARGENLTIGELRDLAIDGDPRARRRYHEYEQASLGRRALTWSGSIRDDLGLGDDEVDDDDEAGADAGVPVAAWPNRDWRVLRHHEVAILQVAEAAGAYADVAIAAYCHAKGLPPPRVSSPVGDEMTSAARWS